MNNSIGQDRTGPGLGNVAAQGAESLASGRAAGGIAASTRNVSLDDVVARLKSTPNEDSRSEVLRMAGAQAVPRLRTPEKPDAIIETKGKDVTVAANKTPDGLEGAAALSYWIAKIQKVVSDTSDQQLVDSMDRFKKQNAVQRKSFEKQAEEAQKKEDAAALASDIIGCAGKVLGGLLVGISVISSVFTGGASLVLAGVGLALLAADTIAEVATGESLTGRLISPLMESVFSPLVNAIGGVVSGVLQKFGVSEDIAKIVGAALGAAMAVLAVIAIAVAAKSSAASNLVGKMTGPLMRGVTKAIPQMLKSMTSAVGSGANALSRSASNSATKLASKVGITAFNPKVFALQAQYVALSGSAVGGAGQAGAAAWLGVNARQLSEIQAEIVRLLTSMSQVERIVDVAVKQWQSQQAWALTLQKSASDAMQLDHQTGLFALKNARRVAV